LGSISRKIVVQAGPGINARPYLINSKSKKGLGAKLKWQAQSPEFKPHYCKKPTNSEISSYGGQLSNCTRTK
jgi:hypothetical protein